jgi:two-component system, NarL family, nitrate/nitrite response regulator NarL
VLFPTVMCSPQARDRLVKAPMPTVLIVDDHAAVRSAIRARFETALRIDVQEAENGADAVAKAKERKPDIIILDLSMPVMNGFEAAKVFRETLPAVPVFLLTAHCSTATRQVATEVGIREVFSKDQDLAPLIVQAKAALEGPSQNETHQARTQAADGAGG